MSRAFATHDPEVIAADFTEDGVLITPDGVLHGRQGVAEGLRQLFGDLPEAAATVKTMHVHEDVVFLECAAESRSATVDDGIDTFVVRDGLIRAQAGRYTPR